MQKTKSLAFMDKYPLRTKTVLDNMCIEQVSHFRYLGCDSTSHMDYDADHKLAKFQSICGTIHLPLSRKTRKEIQLKFYKITGVPFYGS